MTVKEFSRSFLELCCKPKKKYVLSIYKKGSRIDDDKQILHSDHIGNELYMDYHLLEKQICKWWIQRDTIVVLIE